jgi:lipopolysaccharide heptosyltransferase I
MPESAKRFLIIRLSSIGDIVHALPAAAALGEAFPGAQIDWVVESRHAALLERNPFLRRVIPLDTLGWRRNLVRGETLAAVRSSVAALRAENYDAAIDFQGLYKSAFIARLSRARERVGFTENRLREPAAAVFYSARVTPDERKHVIELNLALVEYLGVPRIGGARWQFPLPASTADEDYVSRQLAALGVRDFMIVNPGGGWRSKRWAPENYAAVIRRMAEEFPGEFLLTGSPDEEPVIEEIRRASETPRAHYFPSTVTQFIALSRRANLFVGSDSGPLHLVAAVGTPIVGIYGPTDPARNGPFSPLDITLWNGGPIDYTRRNKSAGYISGISVDSVVRAIRERLTRTHERG